MRLFIAIPLPDSIKNYAGNISEMLGSLGADVKWVKTGNYHLTIKFLGEVDEKSLDLIQTKLRAAAGCSPSFHLMVGGLGFFPNMNRPRVIWLGLNGEVTKAQYLAKQVDTALTSLGFAEENNHKFHLTLGRFRSPRGMKSIVNAVEKYPKENHFPSIFIEHFQLIKSELTPRGAVYSVLEDYPLGA